MSCFWRAVAGAALLGAVARPDRLLRPVAAHAYLGASIAEMALLGAALDCSCASTRSGACWRPA